MSVRDIDCVFFFFQAEDGIRYLVRSRGLGDVYKRQEVVSVVYCQITASAHMIHFFYVRKTNLFEFQYNACLLYTSDAADERSSVDLGGRRIIKKKNRHTIGGGLQHNENTKDVAHIHYVQQ